MSALDDVEVGMPTRLPDGTDLADLVDEHEGHISRRIYADPAIYELEMDRIFRRTWQFLGHESEIPEPGDYVTRQLAGEPVILIRDDDGHVGAFLNSCRHRGMRVCRSDKDNVNFMRCPYHGWTYSTSGDLVAAFNEEAYAPGRLDKPSLGLIPVDQLDSYHGMIFGTWDSEAPSLRDFLGDMKFYLDILVGRADNGMRVVGPPQVWDVSSNWKFAADNFTGDNFHLATAHGSLAQIGMLPPDPMALSGGHLITAFGGHVLHLVPGPPNPDGQWLGLPKELHGDFERNLNPAQLELLRDHSISVGTVFPNFSYLQVNIQGHVGGPFVPFLNWRMWVPTSPTTTRIYSWFFIENDAPEPYRKDSYECYVRTFGPSGVFEQDDMENWEECTRVNTGKVAQRYDLHHGMGIDRDPNPDFPGPGKAYPNSFGERTQLAFYGEWLRWMSRPRPWDREDAR